MKNRCLFAGAFIKRQIFTFGSKRFFLVPLLFILSITSACTILEPKQWPAGNKKIILSFDDGPNEGISTRLLEVLAKHDVKATFCYVGRNIATNQQTVKRVVEEGHQIAIHSYDRSMPSLWHYDDMEKDFEQTLKAIQNALGNPEFKVKLYRPPRGIVTYSVSQLLKRKQLDLAYLTFYVHDAPVDAEDAEKTMAKIKGALIKHQGGAIVFHESRFKRNPKNDNKVDKSWLPESMDAFISWAKSEGYQFVLYGDKPEGE